MSGFFHVPRWSSFSWLNGEDPLCIRSYPILPNPSLHNALSTGKIMANKLIFTRRLCRNSFIHSERRQDLKKRQDEYYPHLLLLGCCNPRTRERTECTNRPGIIRTSLPICTITYLLLSNVDIDITLCFFEVAR